MPTKEAIAQSHVRTLSLGETHFSSFRRQITQVKRMGNYEAREWLRIEGNGYDDFFEPVLAGKTLQELLIERTNDGHGTLILNLMDYGGAVRNLSCEGALSVALSDIRTPVQQAGDNLKNQEVYTGNLMLKQTWKQMDDWLEEQGVDRKFDLILCRPLGGFEFMTDQPQAYLKLVEYAWQRLSSENGVLLTQIPRLCEKLAYAWIQYFRGNNTLPAVSADNGSCAIAKMVKTPTAPESLLALA